MVVIREREIRNFKETPFYRVVGNFTDAHVQGEWKAVEGSGYFASPLLYKENGFREKKDALALSSKLYSFGNLLAGFLSKFLFGKNFSSSFLLTCEADPLLSRLSLADR